MDEVVAVAGAAGKVTLALMELLALKKHNTVIAQEIEQFITSLNDNIDLLKQKSPTKGGSWARAIQKDLNEAASDLQNSLKNGNFMKFWDAKKIKDELENLRRNTINKFQLNLSLATMEVLDISGKMNNFLFSMEEIYSVSSAQSRSVTMASIRTILQPLVVGMRRQDHKIEDIFSVIRGNEASVETSTELQKFLADVLASLEVLTDKRDEFLDFFTKKLMADPVKCYDGRTYDRFSVLHYNMTQKEPLVIACDDLDVRRGLFGKFDHVESEFHDLRRTYRDIALMLAKDGHSAEALSMLKNVLQWAPQDEECREKSAKLEHDLADQKRTTELAEKMTAASVDQVPKAYRGEVPIMTVTLYSYPLTVNPAKAKVALEEHGIKYTEKRVDILSGQSLEPWYLKINPNSSVPSLVAGETTITNSADIVKWTDKQEKGPLGADKVDREFITEWIAKVDAWDSNFFAATLRSNDRNLFAAAFRSNGRPAKNVFTEHKIKVAEANTKKYPDLAELYTKKVSGLKAVAEKFADKEKADANKAQLVALLDEAEARLSKTKFLAGDEYSIADAIFTPVLWLVPLMQKELINSRKMVNKYWLDLKKRPSYKKCFGAAGSALYTVYFAACKIHFSRLRQVLVSRAKHWRDQMPFTGS